MRAILETSDRVTLIGAPGVGKSHLAAALGGLRIPFEDVRTEVDFRERLAFALRAESDAASLVHAASLSGRVESLPGTQRADLLILDDVDRVPPAALALLEDVVAPLLLTSRRRLGLPREYLIEVQPLAGDDALTLFEEFALRMRGRPLQDAERDDARALVADLDGIPGALLLAASRLRVLGVRALRHRLQDPMALLRDASTGGRQGSLDALVRWSWETLDDAHRASLQQLSLFAATFTVDVAEELLGEPALDHIAALRDRSLLFQDEDRLRVPRTVRAFVRAEAPERDRTRFAAALLGAIEQSYEPFHADVVAVLREVASEDSVSSTLAFATVELAIAAASRLTVRGPRDAMLAILDPVLAVSARSGAPAARQARAFLARGRLRHASGEDATQDMRLARAIALKFEDAPLMMECQIALAEVDAEPLPDARPGGELGVRWDAVRARHGDRAAAERLAKSPDAVIALEGQLALARRANLADAWTQVDQLAREIDHRGARIEALLALHALGALDASQQRDVLSWAEEVMANELADRLRIDAQAAVLRISPDGFALGDTHVSLKRRHALRRILQALGAQRDTPLDWSALLEAGWPGEQIRAESGAHRVRVAVSTLRKLGLRCLQTVEGGYQFDPAVQVVAERPGESTR